MIKDMMQHRHSGLTLRHVMEAKYGAPVYSLHPPMVATFPDMPLDNSPVYHDTNVTDLEQMTCLILALAIQIVARVDRKTGAFCHQSSLCTTSQQYCKQIQLSISYVGKDSSLESCGTTSYENLPRASCE